ncbi:MAG: hypothetical protein VXW65_06330, partial [Pseudomonadota bacterium]|nr:hypothetical protein [Pseudomonadota bacterium]
MLDFLQDESWNALRRQMNAPLVSADAVPAGIVGGLSHVEQQAIATEGIQTTLDQLYLAPDQTLLYRDARVSVILHDAADTDHLLHIAHCAVIAQHY